MCDTSEVFFFQQLLKCLNFRWLSNGDNHDDSLNLAYKWSVAPSLIAFVALYGVYHFDVLSFSDIIVYICYSVLSYGADDAVAVTQCIIGIIVIVTLSGIAIVALYGCVSF